MLVSRWLSGLVPVGRGAASGITVDGGKPGADASLDEPGAGPAHA